VSVCPLAYLKIDTSSGAIYVQREGVAEGPRDAACQLEHGEMPDKESRTQWRRQATKSGNTFEGQ